MSYLEQLEENVRVMVVDAEGRPGPVKIGLAAELRTTRLLLLGAWEPLAQLGARPRQRAAADVEWARALVNEIVLRLGIKANDRLRTLVPIAQGIVDVIARQIQAYHQAPPMITRYPRIVVATLCCLLALTTSTSASSAWVLWVWERVGPRGDPATVIGLNPWEAFRTKQECDEAWEYYRHDLGPVLSNGVEIGSRLSVQCLPDTLDPRGAKR